MSGEELGVGRTWLRVADLLDKTAHRLLCEDPAAAERQTTRGQQDCALGDLCPGRHRQRNLGHGRVSTRSCVELRWAGGFMMDRLEDPKRTPSCRSGRWVTPHVCLWP